MQLSIASRIVNHKIETPPKIEEISEKCLRESSNEDTASGIEWPLQEDTESLLIQEVHPAM